MTRRDDDTLPATGLDPEVAALVESFHSRLEQMDLFTLLEIDLNADADRVRRAYFTRSRLFHPDRYYTRDLGPHKKMLERIFAWTTGAYEFLKDDRRRAAYRRQILTTRDQGSGARVVAVETPGGLVFKIVDEQAFFGAAAEPAPTDPRQPKKRYSLPRLRPSAPADPDDPNQK